MVSATNIEKRYHNYFEKLLLSKKNQRFEAPFQQNIFVHLKITLSTSSR